MYKKQFKTERKFFITYYWNGYDSKYRFSWAVKYIFPNGELPSQKQITDNIEHNFIIDDWHNFGCDYDKTLIVQWYKNFVRTYVLYSFKSDLFDDER